MKGEASTARRAVLQALGGAGGAALLIGFRACSLRPESGAPSVIIRMTDIPLGVRLRVLHGGRPVEILRTKDGLTARSLLCTHMGCEVRWGKGTQTYNCPCHGGVYSADGMVVAGPPSQALRSVSVRLQDDTVVVGG
jgi:cytochrome b6-f complex iron-sulfur subunit